MTRLSGGRRAFGRCLLFAAIPFCTSGVVEAGEIFGTRVGKVYHKHADDCASARKINEENKIVFASEKEAKSSGRRLCKRCETLDRKEAEARPPNEADKRGANGGGGRNGEAGDRNGDGRRAREQPREAADADADASESPSEMAAVTKVLSDGTLALDNGEHAVLIGIVCPGPKQPGAADAVRFLGEQTRGRMVRLSFDVSSCLGLQRDALGRMIVFAVPEPDGRDLGGELVFQGYAWVDRSVPYPRQSEYLRLEEEAWRAGRGIWQRSGGAAGADTVVTGRHARCYHPPNCRHAALLVGVQSLTLDEARGRRLVPCEEFRARKWQPRQSGGNSFPSWHTNSVRSESP